VNCCGQDESENEGEGEIESEDKSEIQQVSHLQRCQVTRTVSTNIGILGKMKDALRREYNAPDVS